MEKNQISTMINKSSEDSGIEIKKPHGVSKSTMKSMGKAKVPRHYMKQISGHKSEASIDHYDKIDVKQQKEISKVLTKTMATKKEPKMPSSTVTSSACYYNDPPTKSGAAPNSDDGDQTPRPQAAGSRPLSVPLASGSGTAGSMDSLFYGAVLNNCVLNLSIQRKDCIQQSMPKSRKRILIESDSE